MIRIPASPGVGSLIHTRNDKSATHNSALSGTHINDKKFLAASFWSN
jgi:hypothetical protein